MQLGALLYDTLQQETTAKAKLAAFGALKKCVAQAEQVVQLCADMVGAGLSSHDELQTGANTVQAVQILLCIPEIHIVKFLPARAIRADALS